MAGFLSPLSVLIQLFTNQGVILAGGKIETYDAGTDTPQTTYSESSLTVENSNPLVLDGAGRLTSEVWIAGGSTTKFILKDADGVTLFTANNWPLLNDTTSIFADLLDPLLGVDLVANAVKSYDTFTSVRAANAPTLAAGQTKIIIVEGGSSINDGYGGAFYWSASSSATDDSVSVIKPTSVTGAGRYLRISWTAHFGIDNSGTALQTLGWRDLPQVTQDANYIFGLVNRGGQVYHAGTATHTWTIPDRGTATNQVNWPRTTAINLCLDAGVVFLVMGGSNSLRWYPSGSLGTRTLVAPCDCNIKLIDVGSWNIVGVGVT